MKVEPVDDADGLRAWHEIEVTCHNHDYVALPADPFEEKLPSLNPETPHAGEKTVYRLGVHEGRPAVAVELSLPTVDNLGSVSIHVRVLPELRRQGLGRAALGAVLEETAAMGRPRVFFQVPSPYPSGPTVAEPLLRSVGAGPVLKEVRRLLDLTALPEVTAPEPAGYRLVQWVDRAPDELVEGLAYLCARMSTDAPFEDMDWEPEVWDAARYREKEASAGARGRTRYAGAAVHEGTGQVVAMTDLGVNKHQPEVAYQWDTIVLPEHRGHGLGLLLKARNHALVVASEPAAHWVNTWNAESNAHMIAINEALGYRPVEVWTEWQLDR